ncbi:hypothetical protein ABZW18_29480 [Streptomyces sp. NPDC004647]|uniref:hypothetical protein n=1 Tax=Streptomyces sp. NPDC004647 TaxID=3154671 RepID=UPI0033B2AD23
MHSVRRRTAIAAVALLASGSLIALTPAASAAPAGKTQAPTIVHTHQAAAVTGSVGLALTTGGTVTLPGSALSVGSTVNTGIRANLITSVTNNTNATLILSAGGSATIALVPGASAGVSALGSGALQITAT